MPTLRFPIWKLSTLVALVGVAIAALRNPTPAWASWVFFLTIGSLLFALMGTIARQENGRLPYLGFVTFGTGYLVLASLTGAITEYPALPTSGLLDYLSKHFPVGESPVLPVPMTGNLSLVRKGFVAVTQERLRFDQIGHYLLTMLVGFVGSLLARLFRIKYDGTQPPETRREKA